MAHVLHLKKSGSGMASLTVCGRKVLRTPMSLGWTGFKAEAVDRRCTLCATSKQAEANAKSDDRREGYGDCPAPYNLSIGAPARLQSLRNSTAPDWRAARRYTLNTWRVANGAGIHQAPDSWYTHDGAQFRNELDVHDILFRLRHGWFTNTDGSETAFGIVASLPHERFIAGYRWTSNGERVYFPEVFTHEGDAARAADGHAERFANRCCAIYS